MDRNPVKLAFLVLLGLAVLSLLPIPAVPNARATYEAHVGLNACRKDTGAFVGRVVMVYAWDGWNYVLGDLADKSSVPRPGAITMDGRRLPEIDSYFASGRAIVPASEFTVTAGKCPDGRP